MSFVASNGLKVPAEAPSNMKVVLQKKGCKWCRMVLVQSRGFFLSNVRVKMSLRFNGDTESVLPTLTTCAV